MAGAATLPEGFAGLEPFVAAWALEGSAARATWRGAAPVEDRKAFFAAAAGSLRPALDYLDAKGFAAFDADDQRLMNLMLSLAHVSLAEEMQCDAEAVHAGYRAFLPITRTPAGA
ncbi:hypothetical protein [Novosphingobium album (ex Liu et al. 2023)]|uniref:Uncharacterized protein n=1 Tax=Novosphingobium album (ex Liu et al. 2023) TaxID=3031130 RepID=A0ABT5WTW5_9SPHN|nr:hypothetical protein [Novosphingobium album (ex Liu et al. 2023)]MDE8653321.1 hypothetical protein [Novosphingobium album (ex Liu et al. 2023)]